MTDWFILALRIIALLLLYAFVIVCFYQGRKQQPAPPPRDALRWLNQPEITFPLHHPTSVGRDGHNTLVFDSEYVSTHHATIAYRDNSWWLTDLDSTNGTTLNDVPLNNTATPLVYGDIISFGDIHLQLEPRSHEG